MKFKLKNYNCVTSTNDQAIRLIKRKIFSPRIIYANTQTKGRGTMGKKWISTKGNLYISIFFKINSKKINFKQYAVLNAYLIKKIISKYAIKKVNIKWPNDLLIEGKKICGILQEVINFKENEFIIVGIGINTHSSPNIFNFKTSYINYFSKKKVDNTKILKDIKKTYEKFINDINKFQYLSLKRKIR